MKSTAYCELDFTEAAVLERWCTCPDTEEDGAERMASDPFGDTFESRWEPIFSYAGKRIVPSNVRSINQEVVKSNADMLVWLQAA